MHGVHWHFFSRKHVWHSLKKHVVGFKVGFKKQSSFFSETSSPNPLNIQELNRHFLANVPGKAPHIHADGLRVFARCKKEQSLLLSKSKCIF